MQSIQYYVCGIFWQTCKMLIDVAKYGVFLLI